MTDNVDHPQHYENGPYECILLAEQYSFNVGNMIKYVWRHKDKGHPKEDLQKALWYAKRAVEDSEGFAPMQTVVPHFHHYRDLPLARHRRGDAPDDQKQPVYESNGNEILEGSSREQQ